MGNNSSAVKPFKASSTCRPTSSIKRNGYAVPKFKKGDIIAISRKGRPIKHYAIYIGDNLVTHVQQEDVPEGELCTCPDYIKFTADNTDPTCNECNKKFQNCVRIDALDKVCDGDECYLDHSFDKKQRPNSPDMIVKRARSMLGPINYSALQYNCEHFVTWCRYGVPRSCQSTFQWMSEKEYVKKVRKGVLAAANRFAEKFSVLMNPSMRTSRRYLKRHVFRRLFINLEETSVSSGFVCKGICSCCPVCN